MFARLLGLVWRRPNLASASSDATPTEISLVLDTVRPPLWGRTLSLSGILTMLLVTSTVADLLPKWVRGEAIGAEPLVWAGLVAVWLAVCGLNLLRRRWIRTFPMPPISFGPQSLRLPAHAEAIGTVELAYEELLAVGEAARVKLAVGVRRRPQAMLARKFVLESARRVVTVDEQWFRAADGPDQFFAALRMRLAATPGAEERLRTTERLRRPALASLNVYPVACQMTIGLMVVLFLNTWLKGALDAPFGLLRWGAMAPSLANKPSEAYRLLSANFLHGHWLHMLMNGWALTYLGSLCERLLGPARLLILLFIAALAAMLASAWHAGALLSVGASGAIFGLLGAFAVLSRQLQRALPLGLRQPPRWWATLLVINVALPLLWPVIDWTAHVSGFVAGALAMLLLLGGRRELPGPAARPLLVLATCCVCLTALSLVQAVARAAAADASQETRLAAALLHDPRTPASALNNLAWLWAIDPEANEEHLTAGYDCAREAILRAPFEPDLRLTMASLLHRQGEQRLAAEQWASALELRLLDEANTDTEASAALAVQLAREANGEAHAMRPHYGHLERNEANWQLRDSERAPGQRVLYVALRGEDQNTLLGVLRLKTDASAPSPIDLAPACSQLLDQAGAKLADILVAFAAGELPSPTHGAKSTLLSATGERREPAATPPCHLWRPPRLLSILADP